ncbi:type VI secretion system baseplate subunit TssF [Rhodovulum sulfidophilum]|uniref:type VI secretion system baseplate subunit TssF n=1 Tax=Rhodovulum sulfidophilum TaxID=35806 RepID=UPI0009532898|nr:type VI secretion system baseplate subunit TssF [Rhodovulum sulfidophilum]MBL3554353.1 type VI secretion system baseplate subunit TssF [Rhodovulum sulfidophilum]OLS42540.1 type VI secretion protein [Rhodovulum sulfidophilum]
MNPALRDTYNRELALLKERTAEFARDYPGLADRLGGLMADNLDPTVAGLLEGSAFLAARVQLKLQDEFRGFTEALLDQVFPDALAPTPSAMLVEASVPAGNSDIVKGLRFDPGAYMDARFRDADKRIACRFSLAAPLTIWPLKLAGLRYLSGAGPVGALGQEIAEGTKAGLVLDLARIAPSGLADGSAPLAELELDRLDLHLTGPMAEAVALYEQIFARSLRVSLRWLDPQGDPVFARLPPDCLEQVGFDPEERLFPHHARLFDGFALLREYFVFPRKFLGFRIKGLADHLPRIRGSEVQVIVEFDRADPRLAERLSEGDVALNCAPAVNLFEEMSSTVRIDGKQHEYVVTPNATPVTHYELLDILDVQAHYATHRSKERVQPLYALPEGGQDPRRTLYYTARRKPRRLTAREHRFGPARNRYRGTETFISIYEPDGGDDIQRLQVRALCSNRHLPAELPIAQSEGDFHMTDDVTVSLACRAGPTPPRNPLGRSDPGAGPRAGAGDVYWRLISYLSLNQFGLGGRQEGDSAAALREMLALFADFSDSAAEAGVRGLRAVETRPVTRSVAMADGYHLARGTEISLSFDESDYESTGVMLIGAVLDRFLSEYAAVNSFTQVRVASVQRGAIRSWPPRSGSGPIL